MPVTMDKREFTRIFKDRFLPLKDLSAQPRKLAEEVNAGDASLRSKAEFEKLFDRIDAVVDVDGVEGKLTLRDDNGNLTAAGQLVERYRALARGKVDLWKTEMWQVHIQGWPKDKLRTNDEMQAPRGAFFAMYETDPKSNLHIAPPSSDGVLFGMADFSLRNSGNKTLNASKGSYKIELDDDIAGTEVLNLKAMYNDPSQMREAIAWDLFKDAGVHAPRHTYAKLGINDNYRGLFSVIEQVDEKFLADHFGDNDKGNLYKAYWLDEGPADLKVRRDAQGDGGSAYFWSTLPEDKRSYQLKTNEKDDKANGYDDIAKLVRTINTGPFNTDDYRKRVEDVIDAKAFLRWAGANVLLGAWDNYWATPANYYLYNSGKKGDEEGFVKKPYFHFIPWDYDNTVGIDFFNTQWQYADILDWGKSTKSYNKGKFETELPLLDNLLKNDTFKQYYLDHLEHLLDTSFNPQAIARKIGKEGDGGLWDRVRQPAYLESDTEHGGAHTGRQFSNHEVFLQGSEQWELKRGDNKIEGIIHYVTMRHDSARQQLAQLRAKYPKGASGARFDGKPAALPDG